MEDKNLVLKVYRNEKDNDTVDIGIAENVTGLELYRISLTLLNKIFEMSKMQSNDSIDTDLFLDNFSENFKKILKTKIA